VIVRRDLPIGVICAQTIHAAGESSPGNLPPHTFAVALALPNEEAMLALETKLKRVGVKFVSIREDDFPYNGQLMAIGVVPQPKHQVKKYLQGIPLLK